MLAFYYYYLFGTRETRKNLKEIVFNLNFFFQTEPTTFVIKLKNFKLTSLTNMWRQVAKWTPWQATIRNTLVKSNIYIFTCPNKGLETNKGLKKIFACFFENFMFHSKSKLHLTRIVFFLINPNKKRPIFGIIQLPKNLF